MKTQNVFESFYETHEALIKDIKAKLLILILKGVKEKGLKQVQVSEIAGLTVPRTSNLFNGHLEKFSIESLTTILVKLGYKVYVDDQYESLSIIYSENHSGAANCQA